ncbi:hypothetical protein K402DRAFT_178039 [Aulographum hederae CBS 113979]|uniref:Uncharacterized protein n=1 Tax=Aulographum hederae CBS 113979 TaxID=1176131 RepID=A0A6G1GQW2_9PEZI|nr:hypothetical protein K402DRAFT_178039 [Aulographum hederae CBS 113979]
MARLTWGCVQPLAGYALAVPCSRLRPPDERIRPSTKDPPVQTTVVPVLEVLLFYHICSIDATCIRRQLSFRSNPATIIPRGIRSVMATHGVLEPAMSSRRSQSPLSKLSELQPSNCGIAADLFQSGLYLLRRHLSPESSHRLSRPQRRSFVRIQQSLFLWGEDQKVMSGDLDSILQTSKHLMKVVVAVLRSLVSRLYYVC